MGLCADLLFDIFSLKKRVDAGVVLRSQLQSKFYVCVSFSGNSILRLNRCIWNMSEV